MAPRLLDLRGNRFGRLIAIRSISRDKRGRQIWECQCDCGFVATVPGASLRHGNTKSCGCLHIERAANMNKKHGLRYTRSYGIWQNMRSRCMNPNNKVFRFYGGRGIKICERWLSFENFYADMGEAPSGHEIDTEGVANIVVLDHHQTAEAELSGSWNGKAVSIGFTRASRLGIGCGSGRPATSTGR